MPKQSGTVRVVAETSPEASGTPADPQPDAKPGKAGPPDPATRPHSPTASPSGSPSESPSGPPTRADAADAPDKPVPGPAREPDREPGSEPGQRPKQGTNQGPQGGQTRGGKKKGGPGKAGGKGPAAPPPEPQAPVRPVASPARAKRRHWGLVFGFLLMVILPVLAASWYLHERAADQYASTVAFTVRSEDISSAVDILGGLGGALAGGGGGSSDTDILYEFMRSQELVARIDSRLDLESIYSRHYETDPLFSFDASSGTIEDLTDYWRRVVRISYDANSGLMELRVLAFTPEESKAIAEAIFEESSRMINNLSAIAREDATRYALEDLDRAVERLKQAREALTAFRIENQIVDPSADIQGQMGLLNTLQAQLAEALIDLDLLQNSARAEDPRVEQAERRIEVIRDRIEEERQKFGAGGTGPNNDGYATTVAEFERLSVDREFAEQAYVAALSAYDGARAEANRQSRYLASYIAPTLAQKAEFPQRGLIVALVAAFAFLLWAILSLIYYSLRDRP